MIQLLGEVWFEMRNFESSAAGSNDHVHETERRYRKSTVDKEQNTILYYKA